MGFQLSKRSLDRLVGVDPRMVAVVKHALNISPVDFMVVEGVRTPERQRALYAQGRTKPGKIVTWTLRSRHFIDPETGFGRAVDLLPAPYDWADPKQFDLMAKAMLTAATVLKTPIRWGADWDRDGNPRERGETDSPHFELHL
jgi:peptidoglycan L-alanyl-D-glutamate endopeptidase CwlK